MPISNQLRQDAEAKFKRKELQRLDGNKAVAEYEAAGRATAEKTARLKALRLSRDAATRSAPAKSDAKAPAKKRRGKASTTA